MNEIAISPGRCAVFCARIYDHNTGVLLQASEVESISYSAYKLDMNLKRVLRTAVEGHTEVAIPVIPTVLEEPIKDEYWHSDNIGYSFIHEPDTRTHPLFDEIGNYDVVYTIRPYVGNPIVIPYRVNVTSL